MTHQNQLFLLAYAFFLTSCSPNNSDSVVSHIVEDQGGSANQYSVYLGGAEAVASNHSQLVYRLYGYDPLLADVAATLVFERSIVLSSLPTSVTLEWPLDAESSIRPPVSGAGSAEFYIKFNVDLDMDGQLCNGDLEQDYSQTAFFTLMSKPQEALEFNLKTITNEDCIVIDRQ